MSRRLVQCVKQHSRAKRTVFHLLKAIAGVTSDHEGFAYPSVRTLTAELRVNRRNVQRAIKAAVELGELEVTVGGGRHRLNTYRLRCAKSGVSAAFCTAEMAALSPLIPRQETEARAPRNGGAIAQEARRERRPDEGDRVNGAWAGAPKQTTVEQRRVLARAIRDASDRRLAAHHLETFKRIWGHLYPTIPPLTPPMAVPRRAGGTND